MPNPYGWGQNEPQIKPKDQGGDTISTFAAKIKDAITSLFNTLNSYPWSNATQSASGYMSKEDKIALDGVPTTYLPLSGGTMNGIITLDGSSAQIKQAGTSAETRIFGGTNYSDGASFTAYGKDHTNSGAFRLRAYNTHDLYGSSSGELTWDGKVISPVNTISMASQVVIVEYVNKLQIESKLIGKMNGESVTFNKAFAETPCVVLCQSNKLDGVFAPYDVTTTGFKVYSSIPVSAYGFYIAVGKGV